MKTIEYLAYSVAIALAVRKAYLKTFRFFNEIKNGGKSEIEIDFWCIDEDAMPF